MISRHMKYYGIDSVWVKIEPCFFTPSYTDIWSLRKYHQAIQGEAFFCETNWQLNKKIYLE